MVFNSIDFLVFFPIVVLIYYLIPSEKKYIWLLASSYYFLYVLESQICVVASVFNIYYIYMWNFIGLFKC